MSQSKSTRLKKALPESIPISLITPKARNVPFAGEVRFGTLGEYQNKDQIESIEKPKRKKIRSIQNSFDIEDEFESVSPITEISSVQSNTKTAKKTLQRDSSQSELDEDFTLERTHSSKKTIKSSKKLKLPSIQLDDFEGIGSCSKTLKFEWQSKSEKDECQEMNEEEIADDFQGFDCNNDCNSLDYLEDNNIKSAIKSSRKKKVLKDNKTEIEGSAKKNLSSKKSKKSVTNIKKGETLAKNLGNVSISSTQEKNLESAVRNLMEEEWKETDCKKRGKDDYPNSVFNSDQHDNSEDNKENIASTKANMYSTGLNSNENKGCKMINSERKRTVCSQSVSRSRKHSINAEVIKTFTPVRKDKKVKDGNKRIGINMKLVLISRISDQSPTTIGTLQNKEASSYQDHSEIELNCTKNSEHINQHFETEGNERKISIPSTYDLNSVSILNLEESKANKNEVENKSESSNERQTFKAFEKIETSSRRIGTTQKFQNSENEDDKEIETSLKHIDSDLAIAQENRRFCDNGSDSSDPEVLLNSIKQEQFSRKVKLPETNTNSETAACVPNVHIFQKYKETNTESKLEKGELRKEDTNITTSFGDSEEYHEISEKAIASSRDSIHSEDNQSFVFISKSEYEPTIKKNGELLETCEISKAATSRSGMTEDIQESSSDSEIEFNSCLKESQQSISDFDFKIRNTEVLSPCYIEDKFSELEMDNECDTTLVNSKPDSDIIDRINNSDILADVVNMQSRVNEIFNRSKLNISDDQNRICILERSFEKPAVKKENHDDKKRSLKYRWTISFGTEARSVEVEVQQPKDVLSVPKNHQESSTDYHLRIPKRSSRKRWSDELRKSASAIDLSKVSEDDIGIENVTADKENSIVDMENNGRCSVKSRRSRSLTSTSINSSPEINGRSYKVTPHLRKLQPSLSYNVDENMEMDDTFDDCKLSQSSSMSPSNGTRWTISDGTEVRNFRMNIEKARTVLPAPQVSESSTEYHLRIPRRSSRKRWSAERRKSSSIRISLNHKNGSECEKDSRGSVKSRWTLSAETESENVQIEAQKPTAELPSSECFLRIPRVSLRKRWSDELRKTASAIDVSVDFENNTEFEKDECFEEKQPVGPTANKNRSSVKSRRSRSLTDTLDNSSPERIRNSCKVSPHIKKPREPEDSFIDCQLLKYNSMGSSEGTRNIRTSGAIKKKRSSFDPNMFKLGDEFLPDTSETFNKSKRLCFENVTMRKKQNKKELVDPPGGEIVEPNITSIAKKVKFKMSVGGTTSVSFDHNLYPLPSSCSTPKDILKKNTPATKQTNNPLSSKRRSKSADGGFSRISRIKMPNFAKIHQNATSKLEDIQEMTARKTERAKFLMAGQKPPAETSSFLRSNRIKDTEVKQSEIQLLPYDTCEPSTSLGFSSDILKQGIPLKQQINIESKNVQVAKPTKNIEENRQVAVATKILISKVNRPDASKRRFLKVVGAAGNVPRKLPTQNQKPDVDFRKMNKGDAENRTEQIRDVNTKTNLHQNKREENRNVLKGVRGNRRFELLMKMRKN